MSNALYNKSREGFLAGNIAWGGDTIKVILVDADEYTVDLAADQFLSDVPALARVAISAALANKTVTDGIADADDVTWPTVPLHDPCEAVVIYQDTGVEGTSRLIAYIDTATALPITPNGGDLQFAWDSGVDKIFKL